MNFGVSHGKSVKGLLPEDHISRVINSVRVVSAYLPVNKYTSKMFRST